MTLLLPRRAGSRPIRALLAGGACWCAALPLSARERDVTRISLDSLLSVPVHAAAQYAQAHSDAPASVSMVAGEEISAFAYRTIAEVLASVAGLYITYDRNYTYLGVRDIGRLSDYDNRIHLDANDTYRFRNNADVTANGAELELTSALGARLLKGNGSVVRIQNVHTGAALTNAPQMMTRLGLSGPTGAAVSTAWQLRYESARRTLQDRSTGDVVLVDGRVTWQATRHIAAAAGLTNVFDATHFLPGRVERAQDVLRMDGRKFSLEGRWRL